MIGRGALNDTYLLFALFQFDNTWHKIKTADNEQFVCRDFLQSNVGTTEQLKYIP